ncbi:MAG: hypothetical protein ACP5NZ_00460 [Nanobdellota archaeon]
MKNLITKISKIILIPAFAMSMNLKNADAQKLEFYPTFSAGAGLGHYSNFKIYDNWQSHFKGLDGDEVLKDKKIKPYAECEIGADIGIDFNGFSFGINSRYSLAQAIYQRSLSAIELHNWDFDYARIHEATLNQKMPSAGVYFKFPLKNGNRMCLRGGVKKAEINQIKREDDYFTPDSKCDATPVDDTKNLTYEFERTKNKILLNKMSLEYLTPVDGGTTGFEFYYETDWKRTHEVGATINLYIDLKENKD